ncbi:MAG: hypothetical protein GWN30_20745 [Gammaproteobacteria bacterium]|nr:hypothetical protein [Gammaproteobacteria bacterium]
MRWGSTTVGTIMKQVETLPSIQPDVSLYEAFQRMLAENIQQLHVFEDEIWLGAVTREGILATGKIRSRFTH